MDRAMEPDQLRYLADELENFKEIAKFLKPAAGEIPELAGVDISGVSMPLNGAIGGDHVIYLDFKKRYDLDALIARAIALGRKDVAAQLVSNNHRVGIVLADVAGHRITDALVAAMLHQAFLLGSYYELEMFGQITTKLFKHIKTRFHESTNIKKLIAMIYGEITDQGRFRYISAGHPPPIVFSREYGRIMPLGADRTVSETLIGMFPAATGRREAGPLEHTSEFDEPIVNEISLASRGDILLLATDGLTEHGDGFFVAEELGPCLNRARDLSAADMGASLREAVLAFGPPGDDITFVVIKKL